MKGSVVVSFTEQCDLNHLEGEDVAAINNILHCLLIVLNPRSLEHNRKLGCAASRNDLQTGQASGS